MLREIQKLLLDGRCGGSWQAHNINFEREGGGGGGQTAGVVYIYKFNFTLHFLISIPIFTYY